MYDVADAVTWSQDDYTTAEHPLAINIKLAWHELEVHYVGLDDNPAYVAAVVPHPHLTWQYLEKRWYDRTEWIVKAKSTFNKLTLEHQYKDGPSLRRSPPKRRPDRSYDWLGDDDVSDEELNSSPFERRLSEYLNERRPQTPDIESSPVPCWLANRSRWPRLATMALDVYSAPVMSAEPERVLSTTGAAITPRRRLLQSDTIGRLVCLKAWIKSKLHTIDGYSL